MLNIDLSKFHEKLFVNAKMYTKYLNEEQLQLTACCSIIILSCIEELSKIPDLNTLLTRVKDKSLLKDIIINSSRKFELVKKNKAPSFSSQILFPISNKKLHSNFPNNCIDIEAMFKEFSCTLDLVLISSQELWLAVVFIEKMEKSTNCIMEFAEKIKNNSYNEEQKIILLAKLEYLKEVSNISAKYINNLNIVDKEFSDQTLLKLKESLTDKIAISDENLNKAYNSITTEKQQLELEPCYENYKNLFNELFKNEIESNNILIRKEKILDLQKETVYKLETSITKINNNFSQTTKQKPTSQPPFSFAERENLRRQNMKQKSSSVPARLVY